jgi:hypothetical protein
MSKKNVATLTPEQDYRYGQLFEIACGQGMSSEKADAEAWRGLCEESPVLKNFDGAQK